MTTSRTLGWGPTEIDGINLLQRNGLFGAGTPVQPDLDRRFTKLVGFWAPRRSRRALKQLLVGAAVDVTPHVAEVGDEFQSSEPSEEVPNPNDEHPEEER